MAICIVGFWIFENFYTPATYSEDTPASLEHANPVPDRLLPDAGDWEIVAHQHFILAYDEAAEQAAWVAYMLHQDHLSRADRERPYFIEDPYIRSKSADWKNYRGSGYDRGHLLPAGDRRFSESAYNETFYTSNISPQDREFNAGIWNELEQQVRRWCRKYGTLLVITGGVLGDDLETIGEEDVAVPEAFYKIVYRDGSGGPQVLSFLMPNEDSGKSLQSFLVPIDSVETLTGIDFFPKLQGEAELEAQVRMKDWKFR